jgi:Protein of unknown function (DUF3017)
VNTTGSVTADSESSVRSDGPQTQSAPPRVTPGVPAHAAQPPRRNTAIWIICLALIIVMAVSVLVGAQAGAMLLASVLAVAGVARAVIPGTVVGLSIRSRTVDLVIYCGLALTLAFLAQTAPNI